MRAMSSRSLPSPLASKIGAAVVMSISMMSIGAGAYQVDESWSLRLNTAPGAPSSSNCSSVFETYHPLKLGNVFRNFTETCSSFSSSKAANGTKAQVRYWTYIIDSNGTTVGAGFSSHYHVETDAYHTIQLTSSVDYYHSLVVRYVLENPYNLGCSMTGRYRIP